MVSALPHCGINEYFLRSRTTQKNSSYIEVDLYALLFQKHFNILPVPILDSKLYYLQCAIHKTNTKITREKKQFIKLSGILILRTMLFTMAKRHPIRKSQFIHVTTEVHSFCQEKSLKIKKYILPQTAIMQLLRVLED